MEDLFSGNGRAHRYLYVYLLMTGLNHRGRGNSKCFFVGS